MPDISSHLLNCLHVSRDLGDSDISRREILHNDIYAGHVFSTFGGGTPIDIITASMTGKCQQFRPWVKCITVDGDDDRHAALSEPCL